MCLCDPNFCLGSIHSYLHTEKNFHSRLSMVVGWGGTFSGFFPLMSHLQFLWSGVTFIIKKTMHIWQLCAEEWGDLPKVDSMWGTEALTPDAQVPTTPAHSLSQSPSPKGAQKLPENTTCRPLLGTQGIGSTGFRARPKPGKWWSLSSPTSKGCSVRASTSLTTCPEKEISEGICNLWKTPSSPWMVSRPGIPSATPKTAPGTPYAGKPHKAVWQRVFPVGWEHRGGRAGALHGFKMYISLYLKMLLIYFSIHYLLWSPESSEVRIIMMIIPILQRKQLRLRRVNHWPDHTAKSYEREWEVGAALGLILCICDTAFCLLGKHLPSLSPWKQVALAPDWPWPRALWGFLHSLGLAQGHRERQRKILGQDAWAGFQRPAKAKVSSPGSGTRRTILWASHCISEAPHWLRQTSITAGRGMMLSSWSHIYCRGPWGYLTVK